MNKNTFWIGGKHAAESAIKNPFREKHEIIVLEKNFDLNELEIKFPKLKNIIKIKNIKFFNKIFPPNFKHQGIAVQVSTLKKIELKNYLKENTNQITNIVLLDGITDPRNIGSIIRNCVAFNISTIIFHEQSLNLKSPSMHVAASGAIEHIDVIIVKNISSAIREVKKYGFWVIGLDGYSKTTISKEIFTKKNVMIFGDEGSGIRDLTKKSCDQIVSIPIEKKVESLNVSSAVAVTLGMLKFF